MTGKALLIGSNHGGLLGVANDVAAMRGALEPRGFDVRVCLGPDATRDGILAAYRRLIEETISGEAAVVFYSGHGGFIEAPPSGLGKTDLMDLRFIVPTDYSETTDDDFRGITSVELTYLHARLASRTDNVVVIFDCCYAAGTRGEWFRRKTWRPQSYSMVRAHLDRIHQGGFVRWDPGDTHDVVRIAACGPTQPAVEYRPDGGAPRGLFTEGLTAALAEAGAQRVSWWAVMDRVRRHTGMFDVHFAQRPEIHGPVRRLLFQVAKDDLASSLPVVPVDHEGRVRLDGAPLLGVQAGDRFAVLPAGADRTDAAAKLGDLTVRTVQPLWAEGTIEWSGPAPRDVPLGARAFPTVVSAPELTVRVTGDDPFAAHVRATVAGTPMLRLADSGTPDWAAEVAVAADRTMTVSDRRGPLAPPTARSDLTAVLGQLRALAVGAALRRLVDTPDDSGTDREGVFGADVAIEWGIVVGGRRRPMAAGDTLHARDRLYVRIENRHDEPVYVAIVDIGLSGRIRVQNVGFQTTQEIRPGGSWALGHDAFRGTWPGIGTSWPRGLPPDGPRPETVLVFVSSAAQDLRVLEQTPTTPGRSALRPPGHSPLLDIADQLAGGGDRDLTLRARGPERVRYDVHALRLELDPLPRPGRFLVEDDADGPAMSRVAGVGTPVPLAVRLDELAVHGNGTLFRDGAVRVDALVATLDGTGQLVRRAATLRFETIQDCQATYPDGVSLFDGVGRGLAVIALWVSRDADGGADLGDLLADGSELTGTASATGTTGTTGGTSAAAATVATVGTAATAAIATAEQLVLRAAELLRRGGDTTSVGLVRRTLPDRDGFPSARHPVTARGTVQDFSLIYTVGHPGQAARVV